MILLDILALGPLPENQEAILNIDSHIQYDFSIKPMLGCGLNTENPILKVCPT